MLDNLMRCLTGGLCEPDEFGGDLAFSPISRSEIRARQTVSASTEHYSIQNGSGAKGSALHIDYGWLCQRGYYPDNLDKENQDCFLALPDFGPSKRDLLLGVFDGHGEYGDDCSQFLRDNLARYLSEAQRSHKNDLDQCFRNALLKLNDQMHEEEDFDDTSSGTTAVIALFHSNMLYIANTGDSRAIIGQIVDGKIKAKALTSDHTPYRPDERERSIEHRTRGDPEPSDEYWDARASMTAAIDPPRVWVPDTTAGFAFTRSIGDHACEPYGVIPDPEVTVKQVKAHDKFICLASDGVWEFMTNDAVSIIVSQHAEPLAACRFVVAQAYRYWLLHDVRTDDVTMVLAFIEVLSSGSQRKDFVRGPLRASVLAGDRALQHRSVTRPVAGISQGRRGSIQRQDDEHNRRENSHLSKSSIDEGKQRTSSSSSLMASMQKGNGNGAGPSSGAFVAALAGEEAWKDESDQPLQDGKRTPPRNGNGGDKQTPTNDGGDGYSNADGESFERRRGGGFSFFGRRRRRFKQMS